MSGTCDPAVIGASGEEALPARSMWRLLIDPSVGSFFAARVISGVGIWVANVVAAVVVFDITGSATMVGVVSMAQFGPQLFLSPYMGARADRRDRRRQTAFGQVIAACGSGGLALMVGLSASDTLASAWPVILASLLFGVGLAVGAPAGQALVPSMGRRSELSRLIVLATGPMTVSRAVGPGLGALVLVRYGVAAAFAMAAGALLILAVVVMLIKVNAFESDSITDHSVRDGLRYLRRERPLMLLLFVVAGLGIGMDPTITLAPSIAASFDGGATLVAQIASAFGIGSGVYLLVSGLMTRRFGLRFVSSMGLALMSVSMVTMAVAPNPETAVVGSLLSGLGMMAAMTSLSTRIHRRVPEAYRGRMMALWLVAFVGTRPLAAGMNGAIADIWSPAAALLVVAAVLAAAGYGAAVRVEEVAQDLSDTGRAS